MSLVARDAENCLPHCIEALFVGTVTHVVMLCAKNFMYGDHYLQRRTVLEDVNQEL